MSRVLARAKVRVHRVIRLLLGNGALGVQNLRHAIRGHVQPPREFSRTHVQRVQFFGDVFLG
jgi:hypothetical protein